MKNKTLKTKRSMSLLLGLAMVLGSLTACGNTADAPSKESVKESTSAATATSEASAETAVTEEDDMSETLTYKLAVHSASDQGDWNEYYCIKYIEEKFNVDIQVEMISSDVWDEKAALMFASDSLPDFFINSSVDVTTYGPQGYFLALEDYISEEATPNIWKALEEVPGIRKASTELDGHIYALYGADLGIRERAKCRFYINTAWAEEILGKQPETLDEFYEYLKGVKERDMDGDGDADNEIPLGGFYKDCPNEGNIMLALLSAFGYTSLKVEGMEDGSVVYVPAEDNYKEFLRYMNVLYTEGLLDNEYFTQDADQFNAKDAQDLYGAFCWYSSGINHLEEEDFKQYDGIEPMTSAYNDEKIWPATEMTTLGKFIITKNCENPERLMKIMDWCYSEDGYLTILNGWEMDTNEEYPGYGYKKEWNDEHTELAIDFYGPDGVQDPPEGYESYSSFRYAVIAPPYGYFPLYRNYSAVYTAPAQLWLTHNIVDYYADYYHEGWSSKIKFSKEESDELSLLETDITAYKEEMETKMITGELDIDANWDSYLEGLDKRGLESMLEIYQTAFDRWNSN